MKSILEVIRDLIKPYIDINSNNIAHVEDSPVANPYYAGDQLIYKGVLYNVTADISVGDDLEVGTNITLAPNVYTQIKYAQNAVKNNIKENGAKNIIPFPYNGFSSGTFTSLTVNEDCSITFSCDVGSGVTYYITKCSGTNADADVCSELCTVLKGNTYVLTGRKGYANCIIDYYDPSLQYISSQQSPVNGAETLIVPNNATYAQLYVNVNANYSFNDTVYPMICLKSDYDFSSTYTPCAKTNLQLSRLTNDVVGATSNLDGSSGIVPKPMIADKDKFLKGDGTWADVPAELSGLTDVSLTSPTDGQLLRYNGITQKWENYDDATNDIANILNTKNLCLNEASSKVSSGITFTVNSDGSVTISGTGTGTTGQWESLDLSTLTLTKGTYKLTTLQGEDEEGAPIILQAYTGDSSNWIIAGDSSGKDASPIFTLSNDSLTLLKIWAKIDGRTYDLTIYPMCRPALINDEKYVPYVPTNRQLTEKIQELQKVETITGGGNLYSLYTAKKVGNVVTLYVYNVINYTTGIDMNLFTLPVGWRPAVDMVVMGTSKTGQLQLSENAIFYTVGTNGKVMSYSYITFTGGRFSVTYICS